MSNSQLDYSRQNHRRIADIFSHLLFHTANMEPSLLRKEIAKTTYNFLTKNKTSPQFYKICTDKLRTLLAQSDSFLPEALSNFTLWLEHIENQYCGQTIDIQKTAREQEEEDSVSKLPYHILDAFHFDLHVQFFSGEIANGSGFRFFVGVERNNIPYLVARKLATELPRASSIHSDGLIKGKITWISISQDRIALASHNVSSAGTVYESIYEVLPHLKPTLS